MGIIPCSIQGDSLYYFYNMFNPGIDMNNIFIGTSGYYYPGWKSLFYPKDCKASEFLRYYSSKFNFVEINSSFYHPVSRKQMEKMTRQVPEHFLFTLKAHKSLTHERTAPGRSAGCLIENTAILKETGHLGGYLIQFPYSFHRTFENRKYLDTVCRLFEGFPVFIEFRHREWINTKVMHEITERGITPVTTDLPPLKNLPENSGFQQGKSGIYMRFHGRNSELWWTGDNTSRYDYTYSREELFERVKDILPLKKSKKLIFVAFNNHYKGQAVKNAMEVINIIGKDSA